MGNCCGNIFKMGKKTKKHLIAAIIVMIVLGGIFVIGLRVPIPSCWRCFFPSPSGDVGEVKEVTDVNGSARIPLSEVNDTNIHYYKYNANGVWVRFFTIKASDDSIRTAFDACLVCGNDGYYKSGNVVVCKKCRMNIDIDDVGIISGGCNPIPLESQITSLEVIIEVSELENGRQYFE